MAEEEGKKKQGVTVQILSITVDSPIIPCFNNTPVKLPGDPNWTSDTPDIDLNDGQGSKIPGVFEITEQPDDFDIVLDACAGPHYGKPFPGTLPVGETVNIHVYPQKNPNLRQDDLMLEFFLTGDGLHFIKETGLESGKAGVGNYFTLTFVAARPGITEVTLVLADGSTLLCSGAYEVPVTVTQGGVYEA